MMRCLATIFSFILALGACASTDTGAVDFRRADLEGAYRSASCKLTGSAEICPPLREARLERKFLGNPSKMIPRGNNYSIRLDAALINEISEAFSLTWRNRPGFHRNGEIIVLARAFEFSQSSDAAQRFANFAGGNDTADLSKVKVIYFNPDVDAGQSLSISNLPIFGPFEHTGAPVGLQIIVIELDRISDSVKGLLETLAGLGRTAGSSQIGPAADILFDLGAGLLETGQDDIIFEYRMVMDNQSSNKDGQIVSPFESGRLVFRRLQNRSYQSVWRNLRLDENTGLLLKKEKMTEPLWSPYTKETYFVVNIIDHGPNGPVGYYEEQTYQDVSQQLDNYINNERSPIVAASEAVANLLRQRQSLSYSKRLGDQLNEAVNRWELYSHFSLVDGDFEKFADKAEDGCQADFQKIIQQKSRTRDVLRNARESTNVLLEMMQAAFKKEDSSQKSLLSEADKIILLRRIRGGIFNNLSYEAPENEEASFEKSVYDSSKFKDTFLGTSEANRIDAYQSFISVFENAAREAGPDSCRDLRQRHGLSKPEPQPKPAVADGSTN